LDDLTKQDRILAMEEIDLVSKALKTLYQPYKINVAALGNVVEQLHIHIIARFQEDPAWPGPVWGRVPPTDYTDNERTKTVHELRQILSNRT
jgi:diadenosine tetraphosphate (Ap4A) HIT family hydrolase